jgi:hypothetical protein
MRTRVDRVINDHLSFHHQLIYERVFVQRLDGRFYFVASFSKFQLGWFLVESCNHAKLKERELTYCYYCNTQIS